MFEEWEDLSEEIEIVERSPTPYLDKYTDNLTEKINQKPLEFEIFDRDSEIENVIYSLLRKNKNSPLLIGEPGVGKTAIVEGLALAILRSAVPDTLQNLTVRSLELSSLMNEDDGGFIPKFKKIIEEMVATDGENLLFIDEIHTIMGAGSNGEVLDAGNVIKPVLARGEIKIIGATTLDEYHATIEKDGALERRFQLVRVEEPTTEQAIRIMNEAKRNYEMYHQVIISRKAAEQAVKLSVRYIPDRFLPDKAFDLLDEAATISKATAQGKLPVVSEKEIAEVLKRRTGIPVTTILKDEKDRLVEIEPQIKRRVKGQDFAVSEVADAVTISKAGLQDEERPIGSFFFLGTTGVGKTELAKALAEVLFDDEKAMIRFDMSEFSLKGSSVRLIGNAHEKGSLTEAVKHKPYSIVLFDEIEKGDREVHDLLLQILDDGRLTDGNGRLVSFKNTLVIMTTNIGAEKIKMNVDLKGDVENLTERELKQFVESMDIELQTEFRPEFLNRIDHKIIFKMLERPVIREIAEKNLAGVNEKMKKQGASLSYDSELLEYLADNGTDANNGARPLKRLIDRKVLAPIAKRLLSLPNSTEEWQFHVSVQGEAPDEDEIVDKRQINISVDKKNSGRGIWNENDVN